MAGIITAVAVVGAGNTRSPGPKFERALKARPSSRQFGSIDPNYHCPQRLCSLLVQEPGLKNQRAGVRIPLQPFVSCAALGSLLRSYLFPPLQNEIIIITNQQGLLGRVNDLITHTECLIEMSR